MAEPYLSIALRFNAFLESINLRQLKQPTAKANIRTFAPTAEAIRPSDGPIQPAVGGNYCAI